MKKILRVLALVLVLALIAAGVYAFRLRGSGQARRDGEARLDGLGAEVQVRWDRWAVPHILAKSEADLAAALGYLQANDRMTQLELGRRECSGRLAEALGEVALSIDRNRRELRLREAAEQMVAKAGPESRIWLEGYARGVNAWLAERRQDLPPELRLLGVDPEPWTPTDSFCFAVLMAKNLSFPATFQDDVRYLQSQKLGVERARDLFGAPSLFVPPDLPSLKRAALSGEVGEALASLDLSGSPMGFGSNNWAVGASRSGTGAPIVANDPHLPLNVPSIWYQVQMRAGDFEIQGMTLPGLPGVVIGQTPNLAWALTNTMLDDYDLFYEELDPTGTQVRRGDGWLPIQVEKATVSVRGGRHEEIELKRTDRGPLLSAVPELGLPPRSLAWTIYQPGDVLSPTLHLARAKTVDEVPAQLDGFVAPAQNLVVADRQGGLLFTVMGQVPERKQGEGWLPMPAANPAYGWSGLRPRQENPTVLRPAEDLLVTANNNIVPAGYGRPFSAFFDLDARAQRIREMLLANAGKWDAASLSKLQSDTHSLYTRDVVEHLAGNYSGDAAKAYQILKSWDGEMAMQGPSALFLLAEKELNAAIFDDEAKQVSARPFGTADRLRRVLRGEMSASWFDDVSTPTTESREQTVTKALERALHKGQELWGQDVANWVYGSLHALDLRHPLAAIPVLGRLLSRGPMPVAGSSTTVAAFTGFWTGPSQTVSFGPSMRLISDLADPDRSRVMVLGGQAGQPFDPHYDDQIQSFLAGESRQQAFSEAAIAKTTVSTLTLKP